jgi:hypothetical protein
VAVFCCSRLLALFVSGGFLLEFIVGTICQWRFSFAADCRQSASGGFLLQLIVGTVSGGFLL